MSQIALVLNGVVAQAPLPIVEGHTLAECYHPDLLADCAEVADDVEQGWVTQDGGKTFSAPPAPPPVVVVPDIISDRQFFQQLAINGDIDQDEALAAVQTGTLPEKLADAIGALPADQQFPAHMLICGATEFHRTNPIVALLGAALGKDATALDAIWIAAFNL